MDGSDLKKDNEHEQDKFFFFYLTHKISSTQAIVTGAQIKAMIKAVEPSFDPTHTLILEGHGSHPDQVINDTDTVSLKIGDGEPAKHFFSKPPTNFGNR